MNAEMYIYSRNINLLHDIYSPAVANGETPMNTIEEFVTNVGYNAMIDTIATAVNATSKFDGRLTKTVRVWATGHGFSVEFCDSHLIRKPEWLYTAHLQQLAEAAMNFKG